MFNWGIVILYSTETAEPLALMHEFQLSGMRVGATTAVAVDAMARPDAEIMALFGTGKQARRALEAILCVRKLKTVRVISPNAEHCAAFVRDMAQPGLDLVAMTDAAQAIAGADLVVSCTNALKPVIAGDLLEDGQFVVTIANSDATNKRTEADARVFERSSMVIVNDWESVVDNDQTELLDPMRAGLLREDQVCELGHVLSGKVPVRQPARDAVEPGSGVIYFKNNSGLAVQFAAAGGLIYAKAIKEGTNKVIPTEWLGSDLSAYYKAGFRPSP
jgi:alanine dehydrogenase